MLKIVENIRIPPNYPLLGEPSGVIGSTVGLVLATETDVGRGEYVVRSIVAHLGGGGERGVRNLLDILSSNWLTIYRNEKYKTRLYLDEVITLYSYMF